MLLLIVCLLPLVASAPHAEKYDAQGLAVNSQEIVPTNLRIPDQDPRMKICKSDGIVTTLTFFRKAEKLVGCSQVFFEVRHLGNGLLNLPKQDIRGFKRNWYQLLWSPILFFDLSCNNITEITKELLNDFTQLKMVNLANNKIHKIRSQVIENDRLMSLDFTSNLIDEIEEDAFRRTRLRELYLADNIS